MRVRLKSKGPKGQLTVLRPVAVGDIQMVKVLTEKGKRRTLWLDVLESADVPLKGLIVFGGGRL